MKAVLAVLVVVALAGGTWFWRWYGEYRLVAELRAHPDVMAAANFDAAHKDSSFHAEVDDLAWKAATQQVGLAGVHAYLQWYPNGSHQADAEAHAFQVASADATLATMQDYLKTFPTGAHRAQAEEASWKLAASASQLGPLKLYQEMFPDGAHQRDSETAELALARREEGDTGYRRFLNAHPRSPLLGEAQRGLASRYRESDLWPDALRAPVVVALVDDAVKRRQGRLLVSAAGFKADPYYVDAAVECIKSGFSPLRLPVARVNSPSQAHVLLRGKSRSVGTYFSSAGTEAAEALELEVVVQLPGGRRLAARKISVVPPSKLDYGSGAQASSKELEKQLNTMFALWP